jgi:hypothetical protein
MYQKERGGEEERTLYICPADHCCKRNIIPLFDPYHTASI